MTPAIRLFHISDLHIIEDLFTSGGMFRARSKGAKSHSKKRAGQLATTIKMLRQDSDVLIVSGDLTTDGSPGAIESAEDYLSSASIKEPGGGWLAGLDWPLGRRVIIPGNHDRYGGSIVPGQRPSDAFETQLGLPNSYPYTRVLVQPAVPDVAVAIFVIDSCPPRETQRQYRRWRPGLIAGGYVPPDASADLVAQATALDRERTGVGVDGAKISVRDRDVVRIAVVHHHAVDNPAHKRTMFKRAKHWVFPERMAGSNEFIAACVQAGIQLVLFGHKHECFLVPVPTEQLTERSNYQQYAFEAAPHVWFACCPSTTQYKTSNAPGFFEIEVSSQEIVLKLYELEPGGVLFEPSTRVGPLRIPVGP